MKKNVKNCFYFLFYFILYIILYDYLIVTREEQKENGNTTPKGTVWCSYRFN